jgi:hypothetical protein
MEWVDILFWVTLGPAFAILLWAGATVAAVWALDEIGKSDFWKWLRGRKDE